MLHIYLAVACAVFSLSILDSLRQPHFNAFTMPKRQESTLTSPNPIKHQILAEDSNSAIPNALVDEPLRSSLEGVPLSPVVFAGDAASGAVVVDGASTPSLYENVVPKSQPSDSKPVPAVPNSPGRHRAEFLLKHSPSRTTCNLDFCRHTPGTKVTVSAVVIAVFPPQTGPDRRYIQLADATGTVGVTVWNENVAKFNREIIGQVVTCGKVVLGSHQGKKVLTMTRESILELVPVHPLTSWWSSLLTDPLHRLSTVADLSDNSIINVCGILGLVTEEQKMVNSVAKTLTTLHLTDPFGQLDVRSWNHRAHEFEAWVDKPVAIKRIRVASFASQKVGELLDNDGSVICTEFKGKEALIKYWTE